MTAHHDSRLAAVGVFHPRASDVQKQNDRLIRVRPLLAEDRIKAQSELAECPEGIDDAWRPIHASNEPAPGRLRAPAECTLDDPRDAIGEAVGALILKRGHLASGAREPPLEVRLSDDADLGRLDRLAVGLHCGKQNLDEVAVETIIAIAQRGKRRTCEAGRVEHLFLGGAAAEAAKFSDDLAHGSSTSEVLVMGEVGGDQSFEVLGLVPVR
jgi:hypothetical protein